MLCKYNFFVRATDSAGKPNASLADNIFNIMQENGFFDDADGETSEKAQLFEDEGVVTNLEDFHVGSDGFCRFADIISCYDGGISYDDEDENKTERTCSIPSDFEELADGGEIKVMVCVCSEDNTGVEIYRADTSENEFEADDPIRVYNDIRGNAFGSDGDISSFPWRGEDDETIATISYKNGGFVMDTKEEKFAVVLPNGKCQYEGVTNDGDKPMKISGDETAPDGSVSLHDLSGEDLNTGFTFMSEEEIENYAAGNSIGASE